MDLIHYKKFGAGKPVIILHGLFGSLDNWLTIGKKIAEQEFCVFLADQRNHGHSFHSSDFSYELMSSDLLRLCNFEQLNDIILIGHSMGGKTAMYFSLHHPELISKLIVADISPRYYPVHHTVIIEAIKSLDVYNLKSRLDAEHFLRSKIDNISTVQFLLKNLYRHHNHFAWRFNIESIEKNIENVGEEIMSDYPFDGKSLFLRGEFSDYINRDDEFEIRQLFLKAEIKTIYGAGHWLHADKPLEFLDAIFNFLSGQ